MKKILIIVEKHEEIQEERNSLINEYVGIKKDQGYQIDIIGDNVGVIKELLEEVEVSKKEITSAQVDIMFDLNRYEHIIYVPETARYERDILVYDPDKLDKNMIFYNLGNMNISSDKALDRTREENKEHLRGFVTEEGDYTDNIDKAYTSQGVIGDDYDKSDEQREEELEDIFDGAKDLIKEEKKKLTFSRKLWLVAPWITMVIMASLKYESLGLAVFLVATIGFVLSLLGKGNKGLSRMPELLSILMTLAVAVTELFNPVWIKSIGKPLGILGIALFILIANIHWEE